MNRSLLLTVVLLLTAPAVSSLAQTPKMPAPKPASVDCLQSVRARLAVLRAAPVKAIQTLPLSASTRGPIVLGNPRSIDLAFTPGVVHGAAR